MTEAEERLERAQALLDKIEELRLKLEGTEDPDQVIDVLQQLAEVAKQAEGEIAAAKRAADART